MKCSGRGTAPVEAASPSIPGSCFSSGVPVSTIESFLVDLLASGDRKGSWRDVLRDDRARRNPSIVADSDRSNKHIVATRVDVAADRRPELARPELRSVVGGDRPGGDVRLLTHVGVADVREVRHLRTLADLRVLDLHECPGLRARFENRSGTKVTEWSD